MSDTFRWTSGHWCRQCDDAFIRALDSGDDSRIQSWLKRAFDVAKRRMLAARSGTGGET